MIQEKEYRGVTGWLMLAILLLLLGFLIYGLIGEVPRGEVALILAYTAGLIVDVVLLAGLFIVNPNEGKVLQLFGSYKGTEKIPDAMVARVGDIDVAQRVGLDVHGRVEAGLRGRAAIAAEALLAGARDGGDGAV